MYINAHNRFFQVLRRTWQPILRRDGFGAFNAHWLEQRQGFASRSIFLHKSATAVRVELWHSFNGLAVREVAFSPQSGSYTSLHVLELSPDPQTYSTYRFAYGFTDAEIRRNAEALVDTYLRFGRPFFGLA